MIKTTAEFIKKALCLQNPETAIILGTGLSGMTKSLIDVKSLEYKDIPDFPKTTVTGHKGELLHGFLGNKEVLCLNGRFHLYEGHNPADIANVIHILKALGVKRLIVTNAAGALQKEFTPGSLVLIKDHINFSGKNPLVGPNDKSVGPRFPSVNHAYTPILRDKIKEIAASLQIPLKEGVYFMVLGPNFETAAEAKAFALLGGDVVGMSTVPEVIAAAHCGLEVLGISVVTNYTAGVADVISTHGESLNEAEKAAAKLIKLVTAFIEKEC